MYKTPERSHFKIVAFSQDLSLKWYMTTGFQEAINKHNSTGKLSLHFRADESGIITLEKAESLAEISEEYTVKVPTAPEKTLDFSKLDPDITKNLDPKLLEALQKSSKGNLAEIEKALGKSKTAGETAAEASNEVKFQQ